MSMRKKINVKGASWMKMYFIHIFWDSYTLWRYVHYYRHYCVTSCYSMIRGGGGATENKIMLDFLGGKDLGKDWLRTVQVEGVAGCKCFAFPVALKVPKCDNFSLDYLSQVIPSV